MAVERSPVRDGSKIAATAGDPLTPAESARRARAVHDAVASARLEGVELRAEWLNLLDQWARGEITVDDLLDNAGT
ncbi:antitoxin VbhA family protein [Frigoribacterium sp. UYMn621]|uniref:antitoxin VbhA family protein n=1 Tax=Frigoribacterium sp. UYMn621 TaxID=3156343 RepID=UPI003399067A